MQTKPQTKFRLLDASTEQERIQLLSDVNNDLATRLERMERELRENRMSQAWKTFEARTNRAIAEASHEDYDLHAGPLSRETCDRLTADIAGEVTTLSEAAIDYYVQQAIPNQSHLTSLLAEMDWQISQIHGEAGLIAKTVWRQLRTALILIADIDIDDE